MNQQELVRFEEVTPTLLRVAFFDGHLAALISHLKLPIYGGYDGLDEMVFAFLTLPSGKTVVLGEYVNSPRTGVDLYVDSKLVVIPAAIYESCQQLGMPKNQVVWFRDKFQVEIDQLFAEQAEIQPIEQSIEAVIQPVIYDSVACFQHSLQIYDREEFPGYWATLQRNLCLAYSGRMQGDQSQSKRLENLLKSIECWERSQEVYLKEDPEKWTINQFDLYRYKSLIKPVLVKYIFDSPQLIIANLSRADLSETDLSEANLSEANLSEANLSGANLSGADLSEADLSEADLIGANLSRADLSEADLSGANLYGADLSEANLSRANLSRANVEKAQFQFTTGVSEIKRQYLISKGAKFDDALGDRTASTTPTPH